MICDIIMCIKQNALDYQHAALYGSDCSSPVLKSWDGTDFLRPESYSSSASSDYIHVYSNILFFHNSKFISTKEMQSKTCNDDCFSRPRY